MRNNRGRIIGLGLAMTLLLTACGKENTNVSLGMAAIEEHHYEEALEKFDMAVMESEDLQLINRGRGIAYIALSDYDQAIECLITSLQQSDGHITDLEYDTNFYLGLAYYKKGDYQSATDTYSAILAMDANNVDANFYRGLSYLALRMVEQATQDFDKAISLDNKNYSRYIDIYCALEEMGYEEAGRGYLEKALVVNDRKQSNFDKGRLHFYLGEYDEALKYFDAATRSTGGEAYLYLGKCYEELGEYNSAASVYLNFLETQKDAKLYNQLGLCRMEMGKYEEALDAIQKGLAMQDGSMMQSLMLNEITAYEYLGEFEQAKLKMESYLSEYPYDEMALREYSFLQTR